MKWHSKWGSAGLDTTRNDEEEGEIPQLCYATPIDSFIQTHEYRVLLRVTSCVFLLGGLMTFYYPQF